MNNRVEAVLAGVKQIASACNPVKVKWMVTWWERVPYAPVPGMFTHVKRIRDDIMAYNIYDAAHQVNPDFNPGYDCWVRRIFK
jgi:hypothetical protein